MDGTPARGEAGPEAPLNDDLGGLVTTWIRRTPLLAVLTVALVGALPLASCGGDSDNGSADNGSASSGPAAKGVYVGKAEGSGPYIALVTDGKEVTGYICNGTPHSKAANLVSAWLKPTSVAGGKATLENRKGERVGSVAFSDGGAAGQVSLGGQDLSFLAQPPKGDAGLYRATKGPWDTPGSIEVGWILLADGTQRGAIAKSGSEGADAAGGISQQVRFVAHLPIILEAVPPLNPAHASTNIGAAGNVPVQNITNVGPLRVAQPVDVPEAGGGSRSS
jgi:hypothetical protein